MTRCYAHPGLSQFTEYLRRKFPWKENFECEMVNETFTYEEVKQALRHLKTTDPALHRILEYRALSNRSRWDIAEALYIDSSTLKRKWNVAMNIMMNWLLHGSMSHLEEGEIEPIFSPLDSLDLVSMD